MKMPELTRCDRIDGGFQVKISMSFPLRWVNSYVLKGQDGFTIVDPGPRSNVTEGEWGRVFKELGMSFGDISDIVVTHHHPDHYGLAGWMQQHSKARVHMSARSHREAMLMWDGRGPDGGLGASGSYPLSDSSEDLNVDSQSGVKASAEDVGKTDISGDMDLGTGSERDRGMDMDVDMSVGKVTDMVMDQRLPRFFVHHGFPLEQVSALETHMQQAYLQVNPQPEITIIPTGTDARLDMGGRSWLPVETGGHAPGHVSLYEPDSGVILCGDAVLPQISPNISLLPGSDTQPLQSYLDGLKRLGELEVAWAYPGHRNPFGYFRERTAALAAHHEERLDKFQHLIRQEGSTTYELCIAVFSSKLGIHQLRFAMSETLAHLVELVRRGRVDMDGTGDITHFYLLPG
jgi:glyoxylase-like metal-dependent hydrolase (beta-lactamase superfamily II)